MSAKNEHGPDAVEGWDVFAECVRDLPSRMLDKLSERQRGDLQIQAEVSRLALEALACSLIDALGSDVNHPVFLTQIGNAINVGQPNADTIYRMARIASDGVYRLRGRLGSIRMFDVSQSPPSPGEPGFRPEVRSRTSHDCNALRFDSDGKFDVILSAERPQNHSGSWWKLEPETNKLLLRMVSADWAGELAPTIAIERLDVAPTRARIPANQLVARLRDLPNAVNFIGLLFVDHVEVLRREGYVNKFKVFDLSTIGGLATQFYYEGAYDLQDDEALIIETKVPDSYRYYSLILTNEIYETTDWYNNHSSLNDAQVTIDPDGLLRVVVSAKDPGVANWLDTAGYPRGVVQGRWAECDSQPIPSVTKTTFKDIREFLASGTRIISKEERERIIRDRNAAFQQRPLW